MASSRVGKKGLGDPVSGRTFSASRYVDPVPHSCPSPAARPFPKCADRRCNNAQARTGRKNAMRLDRPGSYRASLLSSGAGIKAPVAGRRSMPDDGKAR